MDPRAKVILVRGPELEPVTWREPLRAAFERAEQLAKTHGAEISREGNTFTIDAAAFYARAAHPTEGTP